MTRGPTFEMTVTPQPIPLVAVIGSLLFFFSLIFILKRSSRIPSPVKTIAFVLSLTTTLTLLWQTLISPVPLYTLLWVTIDWSCSGVIGLCLIVLIYIPFLFALRGPLWVKVFWLLVTMAFSVIWNLLRMALVTATLYYFGLSVFLLFHYFAGAFIDFVYIITFYSLALYHLSKFEARDVMKIDGWGTNCLLDGAIGQYSFDCLNRYNEPLYCASPQIFRKQNVQRTEKLSTGLSRNFQTERFRPYPNA